MRPIFGIPPLSAKLKVQKDAQGANKFTWAVTLARTKQRKHTIEPQYLTGETKQY